MPRIANKDYLRSAHLNRELSNAVRYAKEAPRKAAVLRDALLAVADELNSIDTKYKEKANGSAS
jgi:hypothetical protein